MESAEKKERKGKTTAEKCEEASKKGLCDGCCDECRAFGGKPKHDNSSWYRGIWRER